MPGELSWDTRRDGSTFGWSKHAIARPTARADNHTERILFDHEVPEVRDSSVERTGSGGAAGAKATRTKATLRQSGVVGPGGGVGRGGLSVVGAAEGPAAELAAVDSQTLPLDPRDRAAVAGDQRAADGPASASSQATAEAAPVWANQTG